MSISILVVDDDRAIVKVVQAYLEQASYTVFTAFDGEMALHMLRRERPDLMVLDVMMPKRDGWDLTRLVRADKTLAATPIIMLTARVDDGEKISGLELGADDYVTKPFNARELVARVNALLRRRKLDLQTDAPAQVLRVGNLKLEVDKRRLNQDDRDIELTKTEFTLLETLMLNAGHTLTRDELLEKALGYAYDGLGRTLDTHIRNLRRKIERNPDDPTLIQTVYGVGYRMSER